jgi:hypothetical protein
MNNRISILNSTKQNNALIKTAGTRELIAQYNSFMGALVLNEYCLRTHVINLKTINAIVAELQKRQTVQNTTLVISANKSIADAYNTINK